MWKEKLAVAYPGIFFGGGVTPGNFFEWGSTNSIEGRGQRTGI
jgi:hypothetical protein